jgi:hypothetical protein
MGNPEGKRSLGRRRPRLENNIKRDLRLIGWGGTKWIEMSQNRDRWMALLNTVMNFQVR